MELTADISFWTNFTYPVCRVNQACGCGHAGAVDLYSTLWRSGLL
jgi:hypothetical protein